MDLDQLEVGVVVPTLGTRLEYLEECLKSIKQAGSCVVAIVAPPNAPIDSLSHLFDYRIDDPKTGLPTALNLGLNSFPENIKYITWIGDDDVYAPLAITKAVSILSKKHSVSAVFGQCAYINPKSQTVLVNKSGRWAIPLLSFGPDLIPQPGSLFRRSAFENFGGLRQDLGWAFDVDLFLNLKKQGKLHYCNELLASFRWHPESLSVGQRAGSVREASQVRVEFLPKYLRPISFLWEIPVRWATLRAGTRLNSRVAKTLT